MESLRTFDPDTQRTIEKIDEIRLLPAKEFPLDGNAIARFRSNWHNTFNVDVRRCSVYQDISEGISPNGIEYYLPFFFDELATLFEYLPANTLVIREAGVQTAAEQFLHDVGIRYESLRHDVERPILPPSDLYLRREDLNAALNAFPQVVVNDIGARHAVEFATHASRDLEANPRLRDPARGLCEFLDGINQPVLFVADSAGRREVFLEFLSAAGIRPRPGLTWYAATKGAVITMTKSMAVELAPIRFNAIHPGVIGDTPAWSDKPEAIKAVAERTPAAAEKSEPAPAPTARPTPAPEAAPAPGPKGQVTVMDLGKLFELQGENRAFLVDVRPDLYYRFDHIPGAISMPVRHFDSSFPGRKAEFDAALAEGKVIVLYCTDENCPDGTRAARKLAALGYSSSVYKGGWKEYKASGL